MRINKSNGDISEKDIDNNSLSDRNSIFSQNLIFQNKTPVKQRLNNNIKQRLNNNIKQSEIRNETSSPVSNWNDAEIINEYYSHKYKSDNENSSKRYNRK